MKINTSDKVAVCSRSFSRNEILKNELLSRYRYVTFNEEGRKLADGDLVEFLRGHRKVIVGLENMNESIFSSVPELEVISKYGVGLDGIDIEAAARHRKMIGWTGGVNRRSVSELTMALMISMLRKVPQASREVLAGTWRQHVGRQLSEAVVGIVGCGFIGKDVIRLLQPFGCRILVRDIRRHESFYRQYGVEEVSLESLLERSDVVSLHVPLDDSTRNMLSSEKLDLMKPDSILVNTARGNLVNESALKKALKEGRIMGAAFDVFSQEPPEDEDLLQLPNFFATPHIAGSAREAIMAMGRAAIQGLDENRRAADLLENGSEENELR